jgi:hypothetical protein
MGIGYLLFYQKVLTSFYIGSFYTLFFFYSRRLPVNIILDVKNTMIDKFYIILYYTNINKPLDKTKAQ